MPGCLPDRELDASDGGRNRASTLGQVNDRANELDAVRRAVPDFADAFLTLACPWWLGGRG